MKTYAVMVKAEGFVIEGASYTCKRQAMSSAIRRWDQIGGDRGKHLFVSVYDYTNQTDYGYLDPDGNEVPEALDWTL